MEENVSIGTCVLNRPKILIFDMENRNTIMLYPQLKHDVTKRIKKTFMFLLSPYEVS